MHPVVFLIVAVLAAGCTTQVDGTPAPTAPTGIVLPPRPREVRLDGVDPCSLLTAEQRGELGLSSEPRPNQSHVGLFRGDVPSCTLRGPYPAVVLLNVGVVTTVGVERWREGDIAAQVHPTAVADFPAIIAVPSRFTDYCSVDVDVAPGQLLDVQFGAGGSQTPIPQDELCRQAARAAELMMMTLLMR